GAVELRHSFTPLSRDFLIRFHSEHRFNSSSSVFVGKEAWLWLSPRFCPISGLRCPRRHLMSTQPKRCALGKPPTPPRSFSRSMQSNWLTQLPPMSSPSNFSRQGQIGPCFNPSPPQPQQSTP